MQLSPVFLRIYSINIKGPVYKDVEADSLLLGTKQIPIKREMVYGPFTERVIMKPLKRMN